MVSRLDYVLDRYHTYRRPPVGSDWIEADNHGWTAAHVFAAHKDYPSLPADFKYWWEVDYTGRSVAETAVQAKNLPKDFTDFGHRLSDGRTLAHYCFDADYAHSYLASLKAKDPLWSLEDNEGRTIHGAYVEFKKRKLNAALTSLRN